LTKAGISTDPTYFFEDNREPRNFDKAFIPSKERKPVVSSKKKATRRHSDNAEQISEEQQS